MKHLIQTIRSTFC